MICLSKCIFSYVLLFFCCLIIPAVSNAFKLPDTGQTKCYNSAGSEISCAGTGQDGEYNINPLLYTDNENGTVTDNNTGLVWQKEDDGNTYNWYRAVGIYDASYNPSAQNVCSSLHLAGYSDWRLPSIKELTSIVDYGVPYPGPTIDSSYFPNTKASSFSSYYWSSNTSAYSGGGAWIVDFMSGGVYNNNNKGNGYYVRCVRGAQLNDGNFIDNGDDTVKEFKTGLMWQKLTDGVKYNWYKASGLYHSTYNSSSEDICGSLNLGGWSDWRLPNIKELAFITDESRYNPSINIDYFSNAPASEYWSSTTYAANPYSAAWYLSLYYGHATYNAYSKPHNLYVRCVRGGQAGGSFDYFEITDELGGGITDKAVNEQFQIKVTAKNANGSVKTNFNGYVSLGASAGTIKPPSIYLATGSGATDVKLYSAGTGMYITAQGLGMYGQSDVFNVTGAAEMTGSLTGVVKDNDGNRLSGADVWYSKNAKGTDHHTVTSASGKYVFTGISCGWYHVWAKYGNAESTDHPVYVPCNNQSAVENIVLAECNSQGKTPVLLVPGIMGSDSKYNVSIYPVLPKNPPAWNSEKLILHDPFRKAGWRTLKKDHFNKANGYTEGCNLFDVPYDWRMDLDRAFQEYLKPWLDKAKEKSGSTKVNVVAHSMGGLLTRAYIQSDDYSARKDIDRFAMIGTPNQGSANSYYLWEGGESKRLDDLTDPWYLDFVNFYSNTISLMNMTFHYVPLCLPLPITGTLSCYSPGVYDLLHDHGETVRQLMPTYNSPLSKGAITDDESRNAFIEALNDSPNTSWMVNDNSKDPDKDKVMTKLFSGTGQKTISKINVGSAPGNGFYPDGSPKGKPAYDNAGDGTVLVRSVALPFLAAPEPEKGEHSGLIKTFKQKIFQFIDGSTVSGSTGKLAADIDQAETVFALNINGRATAYVRSPSGLENGIKNGDLVRDISGGDTQFGPDAGYISLLNPVDGIYTIYLDNPYQEDYSISLTLGNDQGNVKKDAHIFSHAVPFSFTVTTDSSALDKLTINHTPLPPANLQADAVNSGGLKTRLSWTTSSSPDVTGYKIYAKYIDEPYLAQIGTSAATSFDTGHEWAENASITPSIYAVAAIKSDGTESFLSSMAQNDDRDHDGLTDEEETILGTNPDNPDTDGDGLTDGEEYIRGTNPESADSDNDGFSDSFEVEMNSDPIDPDSVPSIRIAGNPPVYKHSLQSAGDAVAGNDIIEMVATEIYGDLDYIKGVSIKLKGGFDKNYISTSSMTSIVGTVTVSSGTLTVDRIVIK